MVAPISITHLFNGDTGASDLVDAAQLDTQLANIVNNQSAEIIARQTVVKDGGQLADQVVRYRSLHPEVLTSLSGLIFLQVAAVTATSPITLSGLQTIDGYLTLTGDRVLVNGQVDQTTNGIYVAAAGTWVRSSDATGVLTTTSAIGIANGTAYAGSTWSLLANATLGSTANAWKLIQTSARVSAAMQPVVLAASLAAGRLALGISAAVDAVVTSLTLAAARLALGVSAAMDPVITAASLAAARAAMGPWNDALVTASGSTTARDLQTRSADFANILDWGADRTGVADSTAAIQAAINTGAKRVIYPGGAYKIGAAGLTGVSNQQWIGDGRDRTVLRMGIAPTADMVYFTGKTNFRIDGITFDGNGFLTGTTSHFSVAVLPCIYAVGGNDFEVVGCGFKGFSTCGVLVNTSYRVLIAENVLDRGSARTTENYGILVSGAVGAGNDSYWITIRANKCNFCQISINIHDSTITENIVTGWGFSAGINTQGTSSVSYDLVISNNICFNSNQALDSSPYRPAGIENWAPNSTITGNICFGNYGEGIDLGAGGCTVTGNVCYNNGGYGIYALYQDATYNASNSLITGNQLFDTRAGGARTQQAGYAEQAGGLVGVTFQHNITRNNIGVNIFTATARNTTALYDWIAPSLLNSWINYGLGVGANAGYYKDNDGTVRLKGLVKNGTPPSVIFNLPAAFRPPETIYFPVISNSAFGVVTVGAGGDVTIAVGNTAFVDLGSITFQTKTN